MDARQEWTSEANHKFDDELWLLGQPPLHDYLRYAEDMTIQGAGAERADLVDEWRAANDRYYDLAESEPGIADTVEIRDLPVELGPLAAEVRADGRYRRAFDSLPTRFAIVELDKLVVSQQHVNLTHADRLKSRLGLAPSRETLFRFCLPLERPQALVQSRRMGSRRFLFWSESSDLRFQEAARLNPEQVCDYDAFGPMAGVIGLAVGYGSNFLNLIQSDNRLLLHNGHHRAYALRDMGITHAPCIIQTVTRTDELNLVASQDVCEMPAFYFKAPRPPVLKDFFDPKLRKVFRTPRIVRAVEVSFEVREFETRDFGTLG